MHQDKFMEAECTIGANTNLLQAITNADFVNTFKTWEGTVIQKCHVQINDELHTPSGDDRHFSMGVTLLSAR